MPRNWYIQDQNSTLEYEPRLFAYAKTKTQISCAVTAQLISAFVFATRIVLSLFYLIPKFQAFGHLLWVYSLVCVGSGRKPRRPVFSQRGSYGKNKVQRERTINRVNSSFTKQAAPYLTSITSNRETQNKRKYLIGTCFYGANLSSYSTVVRFDCM